MKKLMLFGVLAALCVLPGIVQAGDREYQAVRKLVVKNAELTVSLIESKIELVDCELEKSELALRMVELSGEIGKALLDGQPTRTDRDGIIEAIGYAKAGNTVVLQKRNELLERRKELVALRVEARKALDDIRSIN